MKKFKSNHLVILIIIFIMFFIAGTFCWKAYNTDKYKQNNKILTSSNQASLSEISRDELDQKIANKESFYIYVGRPSCPDCRAFMPKLEEILCNTNKVLFYYNTEASASKKQEIREYLQTFDIKSIPSILFFSDGKVNQLYNCQDTNQVQKFIENFKGDI